MKYRGNGVVIQEYNVTYKTQYRWKTFKSYSLVKSMKKSIHIKLYFITVMGYVMVELLLNACLFRFVLNMIYMTIHIPLLKRRNPGQKLSRDEWGEWGILDKDIRKKWGWHKEVLRKIQVDHRCYLWGHELKISAFWGTHESFRLTCIWENNGYMATAQRIEPYATPWA